MLIIVKCNVSRKWCTIKIKIRNEKTYGWCIVKIKIRNEKTYGWCIVKIKIVNAKLNVKIIIN